MESEDDSEDDVLSEEEMEVDALSSSNSDSDWEDSENQHTQDKRQYRHAVWQATFNARLKREWCERNQTEVRSDCLAWLHAHNDVHCSLGF